MLKSDGLTLHTIDCSVSYMLRCGTLKGYRPLQFLTRLILMQTILQRLQLRLLIIWLKTTQV